MWDFRAYMPGGHHGELQKTATQRHNQTHLHSTHTSHTLSTNQATTRQQPASGVHLWAAGGGLVRPGPVPLRQLQRPQPAQTVRQTAGRVAPRSGPAPGLARVPSVADTRVPRLSHPVLAEPALRPGVERQPGGGGAWAVPAQSSHLRNPAQLQQSTDRSYGTSALAPHRKSGCDASL